MDFSERDINMAWVIQVYVLVATDVTSTAKPSDFPMGVERDGHARVHDWKFDWRTIHVTKRDQFNGRYLMRPRSLKACVRLVAKLANVHERPFQFLNIITEEIVPGEILGYIPRYTYE